MSDDERSSFDKLPRVLVFDGDAESYLDADEAYQRWARRHYKGGLDKWIYGGKCGVPQFQLPQRTPGQTRQARGGRQGPPGGAWAGPGAHCGVGPAWVLGGFFLASCPPITARDRLAATPQSVAHTDNKQVCYCAPLARLLHRRLPPKGRAPPAPPGPCRVTGRPVRLGGTNELGS